MSNLLLLADVASKNESKTNVDVAVQTDFSNVCVGDEDESTDRPPFFHNFWSSTSMNDGGNHGHFFELPHLPPLHDYVKQTEFDYLVNSTHDYYNRTAAPDRDLEHSYAFFHGSTSDTTTNGNSANNPLFDDGCFEAIANLDEHMGISSQSINDQSLLCEEVIDDGPLVFADESLDRLSIGSVDVQTVVHLDELDVDELVQYILPTNETEKTVLTKDTNDDSGQEEITNDTILDNQNGNSSISADLERKSTKCGWANCGEDIEITQKDSLERHLLKDHCNGLKIDGGPGWVCLWTGCSRKEPFSHRYQLIRHLRCHTLEAPFICTDCNRTFKSKELLKVHGRRFHDHGKTYSCSVCSKSFASSGDLSRHRRIHLLKQSSNFICELCQLFYKDESGLRKHRRKNHKE